MREVEKDRVIKEEWEGEIDKGEREELQFSLQRHEKTFIKLMWPLQGKQAKHKMHYWQIY